MHMVFARICQNSIDFEATFFHQNWVIKRVRNSILHWKLQVILTVLFSNPQNARAVSHLPGCLWSRYIYHQSNWGLLIGGVDGSIKIQLVFGCISIFDNDPKSYSYWKLSYSIAIVRGPPYSQIRGVSNRDHKYPPMPSSLMILMSLGWVVHGGWMLMKPLLFIYHLLLQWFLNQLVHMFYNDIVLLVISMFIN